MKRLILVLALLLAGCGQRATSLEPPELHLGSDPCARCGMTIDDARFAAAYVSADGASHVFDDIGDMAATLKTGADVQRAWVHDYNSGAWLDARSAIYVVSPRITSPMGGGLLAVSDRAAAAPLAARFNGRVLTFDQQFPAH